MKNAKLVLIIAMPSEAGQIANYYNMKIDKSVNNPFFEVLKSINNSFKIIVGKKIDENISHVGSTFAILAANFAINELKADIVLNVGTCGAYQKDGAKIGDVYGIYRTFYSSKNIPISNDWQRYAHQNNNLCNNDLNNCFLDTGLKFATCSSSDNLELSKLDEKTINFNRHIVLNHCKDMEIAFISEVCSNYPKVKLMALKAVTDLIDLKEANFEQFVKNLEYACNELSKHAIKAINYLLN
jgi:5'-methylthioadenosine nucleosidase